MLITTLFEVDETGNLRQGREVMETEYVIGLICERFHAFAKVSGPLFAGRTVMNEREGNLYLTELKTWLWIGPGIDEVRSPSNAEICATTKPGALIRELFSSMSAAIASLRAHVERIERDAEDVVATLGYYLSDSSAIVVDAIALEGQQ
jgi:hypothetical protein